MSIGEVAQLITSVAILGSWITSLRNSRKLDEVHKTTNSLAQRNEAIAHSLGVKEGAQAEKDKMV